MPRRRSRDETELGQLSSLTASDLHDNGMSQDQVDGGVRLEMDTKTEDSSEGVLGEHRIIFINRPQPPKSPKFAKNRISTAKYNILTFVPLFLFEQFRRWANIFFLMIALLQQIPDISPTGKYTTLVPLIFILSVSAIKEIIEDFKRHRADDETNHRKVGVLRGNSWLDVRWMDVVVGDIVRVTNNSFFPADLFLLSSSEPLGMSYIETANLDGETNLKIRQALPSTAKILANDDLKKLIGTIECEPPNRHLYEFNGVLKCNGKMEPIGPDQILLRGAMLRNTVWVHGIAIYTGHDTKLMKNSSKPPLKRSTIDKMTNVQILLLFGLLVAMCLICSIFNMLWQNANGTTHFYIQLQKLNVNFLYNFITFLILFNNLIPISLQVTLEVVRFIQAIFINNDEEMYHEKSNTPAMARTSNLNEELGQVKYIFSDKTGTLTRNVMEFKKCTVGAEVYQPQENTEDCLLTQHMLNNHTNAELIRDFLVVLSVCHTVIPEHKEDGTVLYHAASPDERALVQGACRFGYNFVHRTPQSVEITAMGEKQNYEILSIIEFNSTRKRMSVIVKDPQGKIKLYTKGADSIIFERLDVNTTPEHQREMLLRQLEAFAVEGLRTLCIAMREFTQEEYDRWKDLYNVACCSLVNKEEKIEEAANMVETNLKLLGATAIEDKLQEGVPEAIATLLKADINIWVLTGDKQETAINIGYSCRLISQGMQILILNEHSLDQSRAAILRHCENLGPNLGSQNEIALIIDGKTLKYALTCELRMDFLKLCVSCKVVVCCRVSPLQKAEVVEAVTKYTKAVTLAIGDGANDVAMIQKAHVGVGISGAEGLQAACASDYSIAQFRFLLRLILVHGAWNYSRICKLILYSFYKNICLYVIELWYAIYSGWSGQILFERWSIGLYNVFFTALPPLAMGLFDKSCSDSKMLDFPQLYKPSQSGELFNIKVFWIWIANSLVHSALLFWLPMLACEHEILWISGKVGGYLMLGNCVYTFVVVTVCLKAGLVTKYWPWPTHCAIWGSIALWFLFVVTYSFFWPTIPVGAVMTGMHTILFSSAVFWMSLILIPIIAITPDFLVTVIHGTAFKTLTDFVRESEIKERPDVYRLQPKNSWLSRWSRRGKCRITDRCYKSLHHKA